MLNSIPKSGHTKSPELHRTKSSLDLILEYYSFSSNKNSVVSPGITCPLKSKRRTFARRTMRNDKDKPEKSLKIMQREW